MIKDLNNINTMNVKINKQIKNKFNVLKPNSLAKKEIYVVDAMPGMGKTESAINYINSCDNNYKFIYVTPFLTEIDRIIKSCPSKKFKQPKNNKGTKKNDFFKLLEKRENIICTHSLFDNFDLDCYELIGKNKKYILIMDEVADVVQKINIEERDLKILLSDKKLCHIDEETCQLVWDDSNYISGRFIDIKRKAEINSVYVYSNHTFFWAFPVKIFQSFKKVFILTYKYTGQVQSAYYKFFNVDTKYIHIENHINENGIIDSFNFIDKLFNEPQKCNVNKYKKLINVCEDENLNKIGITQNKKDKVSLSKSWFDKIKDEETTLKQKEITKDLINQLKENTITFFNRIHDKTDYNMWTTFKEYKNILKGKGYNNGFVSCNARATNDFINKRNLAYLMDRYIDPNIYNFFYDKEIMIDKDEYALSEMLQWIFRSRIRKLEPINIYIPSQRMRELLINWE